MPTIVLNDEKKVNSYGFRIPNAGIDLKRFKANPVMLDQHYNSTGYVIGRWTNIRIEGSQLLADTEFDSEDERAAAIEGKVERGFIKAASMGVSYNRENMKANPDGTYDLTKCEMFEASIVAIPSNANALKLYHDSGMLMDESEIKLSLQELKDTEINLQTDMKQIVLQVSTLLALGLQNTEDNAQVSAAIEKLVKDHADLKAEKEGLETKLKSVTEANATALVDKAIDDGKLTADMKESWVKMACSDFEAASKTIANLKGKSTLADQVENKNVGDIKTMDDFEKLSDEKKLAWKEANPDAYKALMA